MKNSKIAIALVKTTGKEKEANYKRAEELDAVVRNVAFFDPKSGNALMKEKVSVVYSDDEKVKEFYGDLCKPFAKKEKAKPAPKAEDKK